MSVAQLLTKSWIEANLLEIPHWQQVAFHNFAEMIADDENTYPCVPGRQAFLSDNLRFGFVGDPRSEGALDDTAHLLKQYGECSQGTGPYASLVLIFETPEELQGGYTIKQYEALFWSILSRISSRDTQPWPEGIDLEPSQPTWEFCFEGQPYFVFCATPAHILRRSRRFSHFMLALQPRWVFEHIHASTPLGHSMKKIIRQRLAKYDDIPVHPSLQWYGQEGNLEWKQYFLRDNEQLPSKCPFSFAKKVFEDSHSS